MENSLNLIPNQAYTVVKPFTDFDGRVHAIGETWAYLGTNFFAYDDGLTLYVLIDHKPVVYRLQWRDHEQAEIIEHFKDYVAPVQ